MNAHLLSSRRGPCGDSQEGPGGDQEMQEGGTRGSQGTGDGLLDPRSWRPESLGLGCEWTLWGIVVAKAWGGRAGCHGSGLGVGVAAHWGHTPRRQAGSPPPSPGPRAPALWPGTAVEICRGSYTPPPPGAGNRREPVSVTQNPGVVSLWLALGIPHVFPTPMPGHHAQGHLLGCCLLHLGPRSKGI